MLVGVWGPKELKVKMVNWVGDG